MLFVNLQQSLDRFLANTEDVLFQMREGGEIAASSYFVKNSLFSDCFMALWKRMAPISEVDIKGPWIVTPNHDNGDLVVSYSNIFVSSLDILC